MQQLIDVVNHFLSKHALPLIDINSLALVSDSLVEYSENTVVIKRSELLFGNEARLFFQKLKTSGASWIHANLIRSDCGEILISLTSGTFVRNPKPTINVSFENAKKLVLIENRE